jgi:EpsI family protein
MSRRLLVPSTILLITFGLRVWLTATPAVPLRRPLAELPHQLGSWELVQTESFDESTLGVLKADDYLGRLYRNPTGRYADLFIAYYRAQQAGESMHSPKHCLPGSGWEPLQTDRILLGMDSSGTPIRINRWVIEKDGQRELVLYWYQEHGRVIASEYWGKIYMIWDTLRSGRRDGAIVRIIVPMSDRSDNAAALEAALDLARSSMPKLPDFLPD